MNRIKELWKAVCLWWVGVKKQDVKMERTEAQPISGRLQDYLTSRYDFRFNVLTEETEYRLTGESVRGFVPLSPREQNSMCLDAHAKGIYCWDRDLSRYVNSAKIEDCHPFKLYFDELPQWDAKDSRAFAKKSQKRLDFWRKIEYDMKADFSDLISAQKWRGG